MRTSAGTLALMIPLLAAAAEWDGGAPIRKPSSLAVAADFAAPVERRWAGPAIWCNRLQDWMARDRELWAEADRGLPCRTAHLLTYELADTPAPFAMQVTIRLAPLSERAGFAGFLAGAGEGRLDYRGAALVHHFPGKGGGLLAVIATGTGKLEFRDMSAETNSADYPLLPGQKEIEAGSAAMLDRPFDLLIEGVPAAAAAYTLRLSAWDGERLLAATELPGVPAARLRGNVALASHNGGRKVSHVFGGWRVGGGRLAHRPERTFGPVAGTLYTVADRVLKLSAQFFPLSNAVSPPLYRKPGERQGATFQARLEARTPEGGWRAIDGPRAVIGPDFYVPFRVENWDASRAAETRVVFQDLDGTVYHYATRIAREPSAQSTVSAAGFTGMGAVGRTAVQAGPKAGPGEVVVGRWSPANVWTPFAGAVEALKKQNIDILFFTGDQIYEGKPTPPDDRFEPHEDYLYKWLLWHWSFRSLTSQLPAVVQPDDHDIYQGNLWGWGGRANLTGHNGGGGYQRSPYFVNMVHRTACGHMPDPYDPRPVLNGISNYYTRFTWGGVGFAVLEDRKFKTPAHINDPAAQALLGEGQERMLRAWAGEWRNQQVKCAVSQTIYASMHTGFDGSISGDRDTGGFPKLYRDRAVDLFRRAGAFVLGGDQHLSTFARLGVERPSDAVYQFSVPAMGNIFWRWFYPAAPGAGREPGEPDYIGDFADGHGNHFRMIAVANPERQSLLGQQLRQRYLIPAEEARSGLGDEIRASQGDGYGIVRFHKDTRTVTVESWPHNVDPASGRQFTGWPRTVRFDDLDGRTPAAWLPDIEWSAGASPVIQVLHLGEVVKAVRPPGTRYSPGVFNPRSQYDLRVEVPETGARWEAKGLTPTPAKGASVLRADLR